MSVMRTASASLTSRLYSSTESALPLVGRANACSNMRIVRSTPRPQFVKEPFASTTLRGFASQQDRPFSILGVQQIAIGCAERDPLNRLWVDVFGLKPEHSGITIASENVVEDILKVGKGESAVEIDLMTPIDPEKSPKVSKSRSFHPNHP